MIPHVSIGMPVYNEDKFIRQALDSILAQDYHNFELIISDNASTDETSKICQEYALKDSRIRYYHNETNIGSADNFNVVFHLASGPFFMWVSGHDLREPNYLAECVSMLSRNPEAVLCYSDALWIDINGKILEEMKIAIDFHEEENKDRFVKILYELTYNYPIYGLIRSDKLRSTQLFKQFIGTDVLLLCELSLYGDFIRIPHPLIFMRRLDDYGKWSDYFKKLYGRDISKLQSVLEYLKLVKAFFSVINMYFKSFPVRISVKNKVLFFFIIKQKTIFFNLLFKG